MPSPALGAGDPRLMALVGSSVAPAMWNDHGKAWREWVLLAGELDRAWDKAALLDVQLHSVVYPGFVSICFLGAGWTLQGIYYWTSS